MLVAGIIITIVAVLMMIFPQFFVLLKNCSYFTSADSEADYIANNQSKLEELKKNSALVWNYEQ